MCFINSTPLIAIIDTGATHSFIASSCVEHLGLVVTPLTRGMVIDTPTNGSVVTPYFYYLFILSSLVSFYIFYLNNWGVWVFVLCVSNISGLLKYC